MNIETIRTWLETNPAQAHLLFQDLGKAQIPPAAEHRPPVQKSSSGLIPTDILHQISCIPMSENSSIIDRIVQLSLHFVNAERCSLFFIDQRTNEVYSTFYDFADRTPCQSRNSVFEKDGQFPSPTGSSNSVRGDMIRLERSKTVRIPLKSSHFQKVMEVKAPIISNDLSEDRSLSDILDGGLQFKSHNAITLPIFSANPHNHAILGVACIINKRRGHHFADFSLSDEHILSELLSLIGIGVHNSMLYETLKTKEKYASELAKKSANLYQKADQEARKNQIMLDLASSMFKEDNVNELGVKIIGYARDLINADRASVFVLDEESKQVCLC